MPDPRYSRPLFYRSLEVTYTSQCRVLTYILPSMILSILLNIPKFLEAKHEWMEYEDEQNVSKAVSVLIFMEEYTFDVNPIHHKAPR